MSMSKYVLRRIIEEALDFYNRTRGVESKARVVNIKDEGEGATVVVEFSGTFCHTCGVRDWVEDFAYVIRSMGHEAELVEYVEPEGEEDFKRVGVFRVKALRGGEYGEEEQAR